jgi:type VI secretion system secreted protein VgrG
MTEWTKVFLPVCLTIASVGDLGAQEPRGVAQAGSVFEGPSRLAVSTPLGDGALRLEGFRGEEAVSGLFSFRLDLAAPDGGEVPFDALLGKDFRVTVTLPDGRTRHFHGLCSRFARGQTGDAVRYQAEIVPRLWLLTRTQGSRIFQELSVPQIVARVLGGVPGLTFEMRLQGTFHPRNYVVQYRETDFDFISRLMEEEGIFYFFRHAADGHTLVLANTPEGHPDLPDTYPFRADLMFPARPDSIYAWEKAQEIRSGKVTLWDHNFETPGQNHESTATIQEGVQAGQVPHRLAIADNDRLEIYDYPGGYAQRFDGVDPAGGERPAELQKIAAAGEAAAGVRMQEEAARSLAVRGAGTAPGLAAGHAFTLSRHAGAAGRYVLTSVQHAARAVTAAGAAAYGNTFTCIPAGLPYRPARKTTKPVVPGTQTAVVVGPPGEEIFADKYGRVKVQFHWDREGRNDASSSCWIRVAQPAAGGGSALIPRIGWEVLVSFLDGDPDRPIIVGSLYNPPRPPAPPPTDPGGQ